MSIEIVDECSINLTPRTKGGAVNLDFGATEDAGIDLSSASASKSNVGLVSKKGSVNGLSAQNIKSLHRKEVAESVGPSLADNIQLQDRKVLHFLPVNEALRNPFEEKFKKEAEENETAKYARNRGGLLLTDKANPTLTRSLSLPILESLPGA